MADTVVNAKQSTHQNQNNSVNNEKQKKTITIEISNDIDILLIGKTGRGKSALGNSLLASKAFVSSADFTSVTDVIKEAYGVFEGRTLKVVDTPGVCDTRMSEEDALKMVTEKMEDAININPNGYHVFIYVIKFGERFTEEDVTALQVLKKIFGDDFVNKFCVLVLTCGDNFEKQVTNETGETFKQWCDKQQGVFKKLLDDCDGRIVLFDNFAEEKEKIRQQKIDLINVIDRLQSSGKRYTNIYFDQAKETRNKLLIECKIPALKDKILKETGIIMSSYNQMNFEDPEIKIKELEEMQKKSNTLLTEISDEDKSSGALNSLLENVRNINRTIEEEIKTCKVLIQEREKSKKEQERLQQQMQEDKKKLEMQEEKAKREYDERLLMMEVHKKEIDELEKRRIEEKEMFEKMLEEKAKEIQEQKLKEVEAHLEELKLRKIETEAADRKQKQEMEELKEMIREQNEKHMAEIRSIAENEKAEKEKQRKEMKKNEKKVKEYEKKLREERDEKRLEEKRMIMEMEEKRREADRQERAAAEQRHRDELDKKQKEHDLRLQIEETKQQEYRKERESLQNQYMEREDRVKREAEMKYKEIQAETERVRKEAEDKRKEEQAEKARKEAEEAAKKKKCSIQ